MENKPYTYLGFNLWKISLEKSQKEELREIRIDIPKFSCDDDILSIVIKVEIDYTESKKNELFYLAGFRIKDNDLKQDLNIEDCKNKYIPLFVRIVYPFIRESVATITKDSGGGIMLPIIDCEDFSFDNVIILTAKE